MLGPNELETLSMLVPCAIDLYRLEENYLYTCSDVMQLCANSDSLNINQLERSLVDSPSVDENGLVCQWSLLKTPLEVLSYSVFSLICFAKLVASKKSQEIRSFSSFSNCSGSSISYVP